MGRQKKQNLDDIIPFILDPDGLSKEYRKNWTRLIQKIFKVILLPVLSARD